MKICSKCKIEKPFEAFHRAKNSKDGHAWECKECKSIRTKETKTNPIMQFQKIIRGSIKLENKILFKEGKRLCKTCKNIFNIEDMSSGVICYPCKRENENKRRSTKEGKIAKQKQNKKYYNNNKDIFSEKAKEYREKNKEALAKRKREWYDKNIDKKKEYDKQYRLKKKLEKQNNT